MNEIERKRLRFWRFLVWHGYNLIGTVTWDYDSEEPEFWHKNPWISMVDYLQWSAWNGACQAAKYEPEMIGTGLSS